MGKKHGPEEIIGNKRPLPPPLQQRNEGSNFGYRDRI